MENDLMPTESPVVEARKTRRPAAKSSGRQAAKPVKTAVCLSPETMRRLVIFAAMTDQTQSQVVGQLIDEHCRRFVVQDRIRDRSGSEDSSGQLTQEVSAAA
jgi:hypothetical protein